MSKNHSSGQEKIGYFIKNLRNKRGLTQNDFAKLLKTSQSAVARMERGQQNFTTGELQKISDALGHQILSLSDSVDFRVTGGKKLHGSVTTNTSKNGAMALIACALLNKRQTTLHNIPKIEEVFRIIEVLESIDVVARWQDSSLVIIPPKKFNLNKIDKNAATKTRSVIMFIGGLIHHLSEFEIPHAGGCKMGNRTIAAHKYALEELGVSINTTNDSYEISHKKLKPNSIVMYEAGDTPAINTLIAAAGIKGQTKISFSSSNYQVQEACFFLEKLGVKIEGIGTSTLVVNGKENIAEDIEYYCSEDPIESMMFISAAIVTKSELEIKRCPIDFIQLELYKLKKMGLKYKILKMYKALNERTDLVDIKIFPSKLKAPTDKIHALPYPGINTDNLPFFVTIATQAEGQTMVHDWMWESRAIYFTELNRLGADVNLLDPHRVLINGPTQLKPAQIVCPPALRPAAIILISMLATNGVSVLRNVYAIERGYQEIAERLNAVGAEIEVVSGV
ncbi:UDP-N-acetylglucosamine 1-carboxyvinyltransferase [Candidatus Nomurabacteria bacterium]|nr:UDP-N-acetylglucosamine 1-carboxyvinyltransferase [Candidatus Nomurabacteria bacterium]